METPVSFSNWREALVASGLPEETVKSFAITIKWYLGHCKRARCRASKSSANAFVETVKRERSPTKFQLVSWFNALRWFFRHASPAVEDRSAAGKSCDAGTIDPTSVRAEHAAHVGETWFDALIAELRRRHYSYHTEVSYLQWVRGFAAFHRDADLASVDEQGIRDYLDYLAMERRVGASTQKQALNAIVFFYKAALRRELGDFSDYLRARPTTRLPTVLSTAELKRFFTEISDPYRLIALRIGLVSTCQKRSSGSFRGLARTGNGFGFGQAAPWRWIRVPA